MKSSFCFLEAIGRGRILALYRKSIQMLPPLPKNYFFSLDLQILNFCLPRFMTHCIYCKLQGFCLVAGVRTMGKILLLMHCLNKVKKYIKSLWPSGNPQIQQTCFTCGFRDTRGICILNYTVSPGENWFSLPSIYIHTYIKDLLNP